MSFVQSCSLPSKHAPRAYQTSKMLYGKDVTINSRPKVIENDSNALKLCKGVTNLLSCSNLGFLPLRMSHLEKGELYWLECVPGMWIRCSPSCKL